MCQQEQYRLWKQIKYFFGFKLILNNSWNVFKQNNNFPFNKTF